MKRLRLLVAASTFATLAACSGSPSPTEPGSAGVRPSKPQRTTIQAGDTVMAPAAEGSASFDVVPDACALRDGPGTFGSGHLQEPVCPTR